MTMMMGGNLRKVSLARFVFSILFHGPVSYILHRSNPSSEEEVRLLVVRSTTLIRPRSVLAIDEVKPLPILSKVMLMMFRCAVNVAANLKGFC